MVELSATRTIENTALLESGKERVLRAELYLSSLGRQQIHQGYDIEELYNELSLTLFKPTFTVTSVVNLDAERRLVRAASADTSSSSWLVKLLSVRLPRNDVVSWPSFNKNKTLKVVEVCAPLLG